MTDHIVRFSRLLRIFELNNKPAFIIELEENNQKNLYISFFTKKGFSCFKSYNESILEEEFKDLSDHCLMSQCVNANGMFHNSIITHFEADCSSLVYGHLMFSLSPIRSIKTEFPLLEDGGFMFYKTKIKELTIDFPKLKNGRCMFADSSLKKITSELPLLENGYLMFGGTLLKEINFKFQKLTESNDMFKNTPPELKRNSPQYFV